MYQSESQGAGTRELHLIRPDGRGDLQISQSPRGGWATSADWPAVKTLDGGRWKGTVNAAELWLGDGNDRVCALAGNDVIRAFAGNDVIDGGPGRDTVSCGPGRDVVIADAQDKVAKDCEVVRR